MNSLTLLLIETVVGNDLNEGNFDEMIEKFKKYAAKGLITASILAGIFGGDVYAQDQKSKIADIVASSQYKSPRIMDDNMMNEWNKYVDWMKTKGYSGSKQMNNVKFSENTLSEFNKETNSNILKYSDVLLVQKQIKMYREYVISLFIAGKAKYSGNSSDYSDFMPWVLKTEEDGINGEFTSQFKFPQIYIKNLTTNTTFHVGLS